MHWDYFEPRKDCRPAGCGPATKEYVEKRLETLRKTLIEKFNTDLGVQADWNQNDSEKASYIKNKPVVPAAQVQSDWGQTNVNAVDYIKNKPALKTVATTGSYNDLLDKPIVPTAVTNVSELINDANYQSGDQVAAAITDALDDYTPAEALAPVATSNDYNDLDNLPTVPVFTVQSTDPGPGGSLAANHFIMVYEA